MKKLFCTIVLLILGYIGLQAQSCFTPVWTGNGYDHMNFYVYSAVYNGVNLQAGDEIGIFDGNSCVGRATLTGVITESNYLSIVAVQDDPGTPAKDGFTVGNTVTFRYCINQTAPTVDNVQATYVAGTGLFAQGGSAEVQLTGLTNTYTITASAGTGGTISPSGEVQVTSGGSQTLYNNTGCQVSDIGCTGKRDFSWCIHQLYIHQCNRGSIDISLFHNDFTT